MASYAAKIAASEPVQRAIEVRAMVELVNYDLRDTLTDCINDSMRPDVKELLTTLAQDVLKLKIQIIDCADALNLLPVDCHEPSPD